MSDVLHYAHPITGCPGGRNDVAEWRRVTCPECLKSRPVEPVTMCCNGDQMCDTCELAAMRGERAPDGWVWYSLRLTNTTLQPYWRYVMNYDTRHAQVVWAWWNGTAVEWKPMGIARSPMVGGTAPRFTGPGGLFSIITSL